MNATTIEHEAAIFERLLISPDAALAVLAMKFSPDDEERMRELMDKNNRGDILPDELAQMEAYRRVGAFLAIAQCKRGSKSKLMASVPALHEHRAATANLRRAATLCEYCRVPQAHDPLPFGVDHIRPQFHRGLTTEDNLCLACFHCNTFKGTNVAGFDPVSSDLFPLFHPRRNLWNDHFSMDAGRILGTTAVGRTTIEVLRINLPERVELRRLIELLL